MNILKITECPITMPVSYFCASYIDTECIDGYLHDLDNCDEHGNIYEQYDIPCPFCKPKDHNEYVFDGDLLLIKCECCNNVIIDPMDNIYWTITNKPSIKAYHYCNHCKSNTFISIEEKDIDY